MALAQQWPIYAPEELDDRNKAKATSFAYVTTNMRV